MKPGRELDALVAEKVMGWDAAYTVVDKPTSRAVVGGEDYCALKGCTLFPLPRYSTSLAAAWEVVEKVFKKEFCLSWNGEEWVAFPTHHADSWMDSSHAETAPLAICLAALKAVGVSFE